MKQVYQQKRMKILNIHYVFHTLLLQQTITKDQQIDETSCFLEFGGDANIEEYKVSAIWDNTVNKRARKWQAIQLVILGVIEDLYKRRKYLRASIWQKTSLQTA